MNVNSDVSVGLSVLNDRGVCVSLTVGSSHNSYGSELGDPESIAETNVPSTSSQIPPTLWSI